MIFDEISFHDSQILKVEEVCQKQSLQFVLHFYDWEKLNWKNKTLEFENVTFYSQNEILHMGIPTILNIIPEDTIKKEYLKSRDLRTTFHNRVRIETNFGDRIVEFQNVNLYEI